MEEGESGRGRQEKEKKRQNMVETISSKRIKESIKYQHVKPSFGHNH